jgi:hypothetical protein
MDHLEQMVILADPAALAVQPALVVLRTLAVLLDITSMRPLTI